MNIDFIVFLALSLGMLFMDLLAHRGSHKVSVLNASLWTVAWVAVAGVFAYYLYWAHGLDMAMQFVAGYTIEQTLSVDNLFAIMAVFAWFAVEGEYRHRVLHYGIIGAIAFRALFVIIGGSLLNLHWAVALLFAAFILFTAVKMLTAGEESEADLSTHPAVGMVKKLYPVWPSFVGNKFFHKEHITRYATPLFICLCVIELSDVMFSFDSVPAVLSVSKDKLIVYSAMMLAILGLRSLYFVLEAAKDSLCHLDKAVVVLLVFVAGKLAAGAFGYEIQNEISLSIVLITLFIGVVASLVFKPKFKMEK